MKVLIFDGKVCAVCELMIILHFFEFYDSIDSYHRVGEGFVILGDEMQCVLFVD